jgi:hypothetical protein
VNGKFSEASATVTFEDWEGMMSALMKHKKMLPPLMGIHPLLDSYIARAFGE